MRRIHVFALPYANTDGTAPWCAFTNKVMGFAAMMRSLGHDVILYAGESNTAPCTEHVACFSREDRLALCDTYGPKAWSVTDPAFALFNERASEALRARIRERDLCCYIGGSTAAPISMASDVAAVHMEFGIGYAGTFAPYRVFESYAWMHTVYGAQQGAASANGHAFDAVIPASYDLADFPEGDGDGGYLLFVARIIERKGIRTAVETAKRVGLPLLVAGAGDTSLLAGYDRVEYVGVVDSKRRAELMGGATALLMPTQYVGPFESVAVEAMLCGTPAITTDWGAFAETVTQGVNGWRCRSLGEFAWAAGKAGELDRRAIRDAARRHYDRNRIRHVYEGYFERLDTLWGAGWYDTTEREPVGA